MQIMVGDSRLEPMATRMSDAKAKDTEREEQQSIVQNMEERAKKVSSNGVVLEVNKTDAEDSYVNRNEKMKVETVEIQNKEQQEEQLKSRQKEQQMISAVEQRQALENINIS